MKKYLVIGGFEPSGHDMAVEALQESGAALGLDVDTFAWKDRIERLASHPMFTTHRYAASRGAPHIVGLVDEAWIAKALAKDLSHLVPVNYDGIISVHPWSSIICAEALLDRNNKSTSLIDYSGEFSYFPAILHERINAYIGGGRLRDLEPKYRSRFHNIGVAVPTRFHCDTALSCRKKNLVVAAGSDGWAVSAMIPAVEQLSKLLDPMTIKLLAPTNEAARAWRNGNIGRGEIVTGVTDISSMLHESRWYLSKGSGTAISEGLAAGCIGFASASGIFWEDDALTQLNERGVIFKISNSHSIEEYRISNTDADSERTKCRNAGNEIWSFIVRENFQVDLSAEKNLLRDMINNISKYSNDPMPDVTNKLIRRLKEWHEGCKLN